MKFVQVCQDCLSVEDPGRGRWEIESPKSISPGAKVRKLL